MGFIRRPAACALLGAFAASLYLLVTARSAGATPSVSVVSLGRGFVESSGNSIAADGDGNIWFAQAGVPAGTRVSAFETLGGITPAGGIRLYPACAPGQVNYRPPIFGATFSQRALTATSGSRSTP